MVARYIALASAMAMGPAHATCKLPIGMHSCSIPVQAFTLELPLWVEGRNNSEFNREWQRNVEAIKAIDNEGIRADVLLYGDSIVAWNKPMNLSRVPGTRIIWEAHFGDVKAEPLGIPGDRIATLIWRLSLGFEKPKLDPKVVIIFIGINDVVHKTPNIAERMDFLLRWLQANMPSSTIVVQTLLPSLSPAMTLNAEYVALAFKYRARPSFCMQDIRKNDKRWMADILHPNGAGQDKLLRCLRRLVQPLLQETN
eukprot:jgi/Picsp_1/3409/NSC_06247-R1_sgnh hydrolase